VTARRRPGNIRRLAPIASGRHARPTRAATGPRPLLLPLANPTVGGTENAPAEPAMTRRGTAAGAEGDAATGALEPSAGDEFNRPLRLVEGLASGALLPGPCFPGRSGIVAGLVARLGAARQPRRAVAAERRVEHVTLD